MIAALAFFGLGGAWALLLVRRLIPGLSLAP